MISCKTLTIMTITITITWLSTVYDLYTQCKKNLSIAINSALLGMVTDGVISKNQVHSVEEYIVKNINKNFKYLEIKVSECK